jgi:hypothetical protein
MTEILQVTDGTTPISLLGGDGILLGPWDMDISQMKGGGVFADSPVAPMRKIVSRQFVTAIEAMRLHFIGSSQDEVIGFLRALQDKLEDAIEYWLDQSSSTPIYLVCKADTESNTRYALIHGYRIEKVGNQYGDGFTSGGYSNDGHQICILPNVNIAIERGHWEPNPPGTAVSVQVSATEDWLYSAPWTNNTTQPTGDVWDIFQLASGRLLAGEDNEVWRTDDGSVWSASTTPPPAAFKPVTIAEDTSSNNVIIAGYDAGGGAIYRSTDGGDIWALRNGTVGADNIVRGPNVLVYRPSDGYFYVADESVGGISRSNDEGLNWTSVYNPGANLRGIFLSSDDYIYATLDIASSVNAIVRSSNGTTWEVVWSRVRTGGEWINAFAEDDTYLYAATAHGWILRSEDGTDWDVIYNGASPGDFWELLYNSTNGSLYAINLSQTNVYKSADRGITWAQSNITSFTNAFTLAQRDSGAVYLGENGDIFEEAVQTAITMGRAVTTNDEVYVANKRNIANLTHIKQYDASGPTYTDLFPMSSFPVDLFPDPPAAGDIVYFGIEDPNVANSGPFCNLIFDLSSAFAATSHTFVWEYSSGWSTLTVSDKTVAFSNLSGPSGVFWEQPSDWATAAIDGVTAYWVRVRLSAVSSPLDVPAQQNREIYTAILPYVDISAAQISGDIEALLQIKVTNRSDEDGRGGSAPDLWSNRIICGLREYSKGTDFQAYINISGEQNPVGVSIAATGGNTTLIADSTAPTGFKARYNPTASPEAMATQVTISFDPTIAQDFYGKFHAFLRVHRTAGSASDFDIQLQVTSGSGGISSTTNPKQVQGTTAWELLDFGRIVMPAGGEFKSTDLGDISEIRIQASAANNTPHLDIFDLVLIPVDEWAGDFRDEANVTDSVIGSTDGILRLLDTDSITDPKTDIKSIVRQKGSDFITSRYKPVSPNQAILNAGVQQRLWFLAAKTSATGTSFNWISEPEMCHSIQVFKHERYLMPRGVN